MKKYISLALATAAAIACSKVAPEDISPIESLPQDENTENIFGEPSGEKIIISLAQTKVSLDGEGNYQFDGGEVIYVKAASTGAVATLTNSGSDKNVFTGKFNDVLGKDSETFDFYFNCTEDTKVQNGQPWLSAKGIYGTRKAGTEYSYELSDVQLKQLDGYICLALQSPYNGSVDFHTITDSAPQHIQNIKVTANETYFLNVQSGITGGFYLAVKEDGKDGIMYTSYGSSASIDANTSVKVKAFTPMSISGSLTGFETTYDLYKTKGAGAANSESNDYMARGNLKISVQGISNSLLSLDSITITSSDGKTIGSSKSQPEWSNKEYTWYFNDASSHTKWGKLTVTATAVFNTPAGKVTAKVPALSRHITGLPFNCDDFSKESENWTKSTLKITFETAGIYFYQGSSASPYCTLKQNIHAPGDVSVSMNAEFYKEKTAVVRFNKATLALTLGSLTISTANTTTQTLSTEGIINGNSELKGSFSYDWGANITAKARIGKIHILYK